MPAPTIDPETGVIIHDQYAAVERFFSASEAPFRFNVAGGSFPSGLSFQPLQAVLGEADTNLFTADAHGLLDGHTVVFSTLAGGAGLAVDTIYHVVNATEDTFQLAASSAGAPINFTTDVTVGSSLYRPGQLIGAAHTAGLADVRLTATNASGTSAPVVFAVAIRAGAAVPDTNTDWVWDLGSNKVIPQTSSVLNLTPPEDDAVLATIKEATDWMARLRVVKAGTVLAPVVSSLEMIFKEYEPEVTILLSADFDQQGTGMGTSYLLYTSVMEIVALGNYEADFGTGFSALVELKMTFENPEAIGPEDLTIRSNTFRVRLEREIGRE